LCGVLLHRHPVGLKPHPILHQVVRLLHDLVHIGAMIVVQRIQLRATERELVAIEDAEAREHRGMRRGIKRDVAVGTSRNGVLNPPAALLNESVTIVLPKMLPVSTCGVSVILGTLGGGVPLITHCVRSSNAAFAAYAKGNLFGSITPGIPVEGPGVNS
jgi:hypothetical protein